MNKITTLAISKELGEILDYYSNNLAAEIQKIWISVADTTFESTIERFHKALPWLDTSIIEQPISFYGLPSVDRHIWFINPAQDKAFFLNRFDPPIQEYGRDAQQYLDLLDRYIAQDIDLLICYPEEE